MTPRIGNSPRGEAFSTFQQNLERIKMNCSRERHSEAKPQGFDHDYFFNRKEAQKAQRGFRICDVTRNSSSTKRLGYWFVAPNQNATPLPSDECLSRVGPTKILFVYLEPLCG
ncbi:MAG TPA: hypothetical protein VFT72_18735 [Opitutaceae bacterium]|nr:hypothetical protein [Opitutaceae bacterium]